MKQILATLLFLIGSQINAETAYVTLEKDNALTVVEPFKTQKGALSPFLRQAINA